MAAGHAGLVARPDLVPVVAGFGAARSAGVIHGAMFTLGGHAGGVGPPEDGDSLSLTGSTVGDEGLTVTVFMDRTLAHIRHTRPVEWREVNHTVTLLELPRLDLLTLSVGAELDFDAAGAQEGRGPAGRMLLGADLVSIDSPRLGKLVHVELELAVASHGVIALVAVVVAAEATESAAQVGGGHDLHETVSVPRDLQTCDGGQFEQVSVQVYVHPGAVVGQGDPGTVPPDCQVLVEAEDQTSQSYLNRLSPGEGASPSGVVLHQNREAGVWTVEVDAVSWTSRGGAATVTSQDVLTGSLEVKGPAIERVVMRVSKDCAHPRLFSANWTAAGPVQDLIRGAAGDWYAVFGTTLDVSFNAGAESAVNRGPHVSFPVDLVPDPAVLHLLHLHVGQTLLAALVAMTTPRFGAAPPADHGGVLAGAGGAVVVGEGGAVFVDLAVEQAASQGQVEHLSLTDTSGAALSRRGVAEVGGAGQDRTHLPHAQSPASSARALDAGFALWTELLLLFVQSTLEDAAGAGGAALLGVDLGVLAVDDTLDLGLGDDSFLAASADAGFGGAGP